MSDPAPRCSVVLRVFNEEHHIRRLLTGIYQQTIRELEVIVVDSGSTDSTLAIVGEYPVKLLSIAPQDFTFGRSLNLGCENATGELIVIASAHVYPVFPDWIERLIEPLADPNVALAYGKQRGTADTHFSEAQHFAKLYPENSRGDQDGPFCNNANAAVHRALWLKHPYDERLPGLEDLEWAMWAKAQGYGVSYVAEAEVVHVHDETPRQVFNRYRREAIALKRLRPQEHIGLLDFLRLFASNVGSDAQHAVREGAPLDAWPEILWFRFMQFWGTYRGFGHRGPLGDDLKQVFYYPRGYRADAPAPVRTVEPIDYSSERSDG
ncbi:MAG: glycosyltransferase [Anaerolineae bacterium]|nr:MAG: glycosyltransferase [Anaerolineae bacterium]